MGTSLQNNIEMETTFDAPLSKGDKMEGIASMGNMLAGQISQANEDGEFIINHQLKAQKALSCLLTPQIGDLVLYWQENPQTVWIISVLRAESKQTRELALPDNEAMTINTKTLTVNAADAIRFNAIKEININVALGKLNECARSVCQMVQGSLVQLTKHFISKSEYLDFHAEKLLKSHGTQQLITAEKDIRMDADRINMG